MNLQKTYDTIAKHWHQDHAQDTWWIDGINKFISFLSPGNSVLDVGCGTGVKAKYLVDHGLKVIGIDFSKEMIAVAKKEVPSATFYVMDMEQVGELRENFDAVFAQASLLHIPKTKVALVLGGLKEKLKPGGYMYVAVKEVKSGGPEEEIKKESDYGFEYERFFSYFAPEEIRSDLQDVGLEICYESVIQSGKTNWIQIIGRKI